MLTEPLNYELPCLNVPNVLVWSSIIYGLSGPSILGGAAYGGGESPAPALTFVAPSGEVGRLSYIVSGRPVPLKSLLDGLPVKRLYLFNCLYLVSSVPFTTS